MKSDMPHRKWEGEEYYPACNVLLIE